MTTHDADRDRLRMPGGEPTDEDLRHDVELTRRELAATVAALTGKADVGGRMKAAAHRGAATVRSRGEELAARLPPPVAGTVVPAWRSAWDRPAVPLGGLVALLTVLWGWRRLRRR